MKNIITFRENQFVLGVLAVLAACHTSNAQYIDDLSGVTGFGEALLSDLGFHANSFVASGSQFTYDASPIYR